MSPFVIVALRSSQSFIVGLGTVYVGRIRHRLAPAFVFVTVLTVIVCLTTSWWVYPPLTAIATGSMSPLTKAAILVLVVFHIVRVVAHASPKLTRVPPPFLAVATCTARWRLPFFLASRPQRTRVRRRSGCECAAI